MGGTALSLQPARDSTRSEGSCMISFGKAGPRSRLELIRSSVMRQRPGIRVIATVLTLQLLTSHVSEEASTLQAPAESTRGRGAALLHRARRDALVAHQRRRGCRRWCRALR